MHHLGSDARTARCLRCRFSLAANTPQQSAVSTVMNGARLPTEVALFPQAPTHPPTHEDPPTHPPPTGGGAHLQIYSHSAHRGGWGQTGLK